MERVFSFFQAPAKTVVPFKDVDIRGIYLYITTYKLAADNTAKLRAMSDKEEARKFKVSHFDFACFSGTFSYRKDDCLIEHSGLLCFDFDHVGDMDAVYTLRTGLINDSNFTTWLLFISPSGDGLKWVVEIDLALCNHQTWFLGIRNYIKATYGLEVDEKCSNVSRACFLPHDATCYVHPSILQQPDICPF